LPPRHQIEIGGQMVWSDETAFGLIFAGTDDITPLQSLTNLTELSLNGNPLSQEQIDELQKALPNCEIAF